MKFELLPVIDTMLELYKQPRTAARFQQYLKIVQGDNKDDMVMPVGGFNPMAKEHAVSQLMELKHLGAEAIIAAALANIPPEITKPINSGIFRVALNLADDLLGGWTNRYTTDYDSKYKIDALLSRRFCVPLFWTSERFTGDMIKQRTQEYVYRTIYRLATPRPTTLQQHIEQERYICRNIVHAKSPADTDFKKLDAFYKLHETTDSYPIIFNFLYGHAASQSLGLPVYGIMEELAGYKYAQLTA